MEGFAAEIAGATGNSKRELPEAPQTPSLVGMGEYSGMKQTDAILKALKSGPQSTRELWTALANGGMKFKKVAYITSVISRMKHQVERLPDGKLALKQAG